MPWFTNGWVVGIATSVLGGGLISLISWYLLSKRKRQEFLQRVALANREVMYAIRPGIAEGHIPSTDVLDAMANATARKYELERKDLFAPPELADELIKEVMDSSFLSSAQKMEYCAKLTPLREHSVVEARVRESEYAADQTITFISFILGLIAVVTTLIFQNAGLLDRFKNVLDRTQIRVLAASIIFAAILLLLLLFLRFSGRTVRDTTERIREISKKITAATKRLR
jgi:hypothetical protein